MAQVQNRIAISRVMRSSAGIQGCIPIEQLEMITVVIICGSSETRNLVDYSSHGTQAAECVGKSTAKLYYLGHHTFLG
jgi:hypothetical protein